jgi:hypothetical protein
MAGDSPRFPCPNCGHQRTAARCWECDLRDASDRAGFLELAATAVTTATLLPFVQAIAAKAGEDVWSKIATLIRPGRREAISERLAGADLIELVARDRHLIITMPKRLSSEATRHLRDVVATLQDADGCFRISYDAASRSWEITPANDELRRIESQPPDD